MPHSLFDHPGEVAGELRSHDWSRSPLGPVDTWPDALKTLIPIMLHSEGAKVLLWGPDLITLHNDAYYPFLGTSFRNIVGKPFREARPDIWPSLSGYLAAAMEGKAQLLNNFKAITRKDGAQQAVYITACYTPVVAAGKVLGIWADIYDNTPILTHRRELQRENERLYELYAAAPFLIAVGTVPDFRFTFVNTAFSRFYGDRPLIGHTVAEAIPEAAEQGFTLLLDEVARSGKPWIANGAELRVHNPGCEPELRYVDFVYQPSRNAAGEVTAILCFGSDETERHRARREAEELQSRLLHAARISAMGTMAMTLAHELTQPMTAARNFLSAARRFVEREAKTDASEAITLADDQIGRARVIIQRAREMVSSATPRSEKVALKEPLEAALGLVKQEFPERTFDVAVRLARTARNVRGDRMQLEQVLINVIRNAVNATPAEEPVRLEVTSEQAGELTRVCLRDHGSGMEPERRRMLFEALHPPSGKGLGVGLALCRTMIESHEGKIWAEQPDGPGTAVCFTLPRE